MWAVVCGGPSVSRTGSLGQVKKKRSALDVKEPNSAETAPKIVQVIQFMHKRIKHDSSLSSLKPPRKKKKDIFILKD